MSNEEDNSNYSDYDEESFDNESIEEISDVDESISSGEQNSNIKSLTVSVDNLSCEEEKDNELSSLNSEEDSNAVLEVIEKNMHESMKYIQRDNEHEIDESDSNDVSELEVVNNFKSLDIQTDKNLSKSIPETENSICNGNEDGEDSSNQSDIELHVTSQTPTSFNSENHAFHMDIIQRQTQSNVSIRSKNANRKSLSFTNERMREIERHNKILLRKILTQKPRKDNVTYPNIRATTSAINRKKQQRQIDLDNQVLKRKIEAISVRRRQSLYQL